MDVNINHLSAFIYTLDCDLRFTFCNTAYAMALKLELPKILGRTIEEIFSLPPHNRLIKTWRQHHLEVIRNAHTLNCEESGLLGTHDPHSYLTQKSPIYTEPKKVVGIIVVALPFSAKMTVDYATYKKSHTALENIIANMPGHVYWKDINGIYLGCNNRQARSLGLKKGSEVIGKTDLELPWEKDSAQRFRENDSLVMESATTITTEESAIVDGKATIVLSQKTPLIDSENKSVIGVLGISLDIGKQKEAEEIALIEKGKALRANQAKTTFIANVSHDIRTVLGGMLGTAENILVDVSSTAHVYEYARDLLKASHSLVNFLNEVIDLSRFDLGASFKQKIHFSLKQLVEDLEILLLPSFHQKNLSFQISIEKDIPNILYGNKILLQRILLNLLGNAIKFTPEGHVHLKISMSISAKNRPAFSLIFVVEDTGIGIAKKDYKIIFERFIRLTPSYQNLQMGAGLGLYMVKQFVKSLKGEIQIESKVGHGSQFKVILPFKKGKVASYKNSSSTLKEEDVELRAFLESNPAWRTLKILIVEDHDLTKKIILNKFLALHCEVDVTNKGHEAIEKFIKNKYDLIYMDIGLPDLNGLDVTKKIRHYEKQYGLFPVNIIGLTAHLGAPYKKKCLAAGMNDMLTKPINNIAIKHHLESIMEKKSLLLQEEPTQTSPSSPSEVSGAKIIDLEMAVQSVKTLENAKFMLKEFMELLPKEFLILTQSYQNQDWENLEAATHRLHGVTCYCGVPALRIALFNLEKTLKENQMEDIITAFNQVTFEIERLTDFYNTQG